MPGTVAALTEFDSGATVHGTWLGRGVSGQAAPITLSPDALSAYLIWTPDADIYDDDMLFQAAQIGGDRRLVPLRQSSRL